MFPRKNEQSSKIINTKIWKEKKRHIPKGGEKRRIHFRESGGAFASEETQYVVMSMGSLTDK